MTVISSPGFPKSIFAYTFLRYHAYSLWLFTQSDLKTIVIPKTVFGTLSALAFPIFEINYIRTPTISELLWRIPLTAFWVWIILLPFVIDNQRLALSIEEDKVNKPWRAIASGRLDKSYAKILMLWLYVATIVISSLIGGLPHAFLGILLGTWYNHFGGSDNSCITRNLINGLGYVVFSSGAMEVAMGTPLLRHGFNTPSHINISDIKWSALSKLWRWHLTLGAVIVSTAHFQDMYDQAGDHVRGRRTVPLVVGDSIARLSLAIGVIFWSLLCPYFWESGTNGYACVGLVGTIVALRILFCRSVPQDKVTFLFWNSWLMCVYALPLSKSMNGG